MENNIYVDRQLEEVEKHWKKAHLPLDERPVLKLRYSNACKQLDKLLYKNKPILDVGCRFGCCMEYLISKGFVNIKGADLVELAVKEAVSRGLDVVLNDAHDMSVFEDNEFCAVIMLHSLEHCYNTKKVVKNVYRVLKEDGLFYVEVPGTQNPKEEIKDRSDIKTGKVHEVRFTKQEMYELVEGLFEIVYYEFNKGGQGKGGPRIMCLCQKVV
jgi:SAM-dependent methyltransferase